MISLLGVALGYATRNTRFAFHAGNFALYALAVFLVFVTGLALVQDGIAAVPVGLLFLWLARGCVRRARAPWFYQPSIFGGDTAPPPAHGRVLQQGLDGVWR